MEFNPFDILFLVIVIWMVVEILNNSDWGGGRRVRTYARAAVPGSCAA
jgi:hypothetical protein